MAAWTTTLKLSVKYSSHSTYLQDTKPHHYVLPYPMHTVADTLASGHTAPVINWLTSVRIVAEATSCVTVLHSKQRGNAYERYISPGNFGLSLSLTWTTKGILHDGRLGPKPFATRRYSAREPAAHICRTRSGTLVNDTAILQTPDEQALVGPMRGQDQATDQHQASQSMIWAHRLGRCSLST